MSGLAGPPGVENPFSLNSVPGGTQNPHNLEKHEKYRFLVDRFVDIANDCLTLNLRRQFASKFNVMYSEKLSILIDIDHGNDHASSVGYDDLIAKAKGNALIPGKTILKIYYFAPVDEDTYIQESKSEAVPVLFKYYDPHKTKSGTKCFRGKFHSWADEKDFEKGFYLTVYDSKSCPPLLFLPMDKIRGLDQDERPKNLDISSPFHCPDLLMSVCEGERREMESALQDQEALLEMMKQFHRVMAQRVGRTGMGSSIASWILNIQY